MADNHIPYQFRSAINGFNREDVVAYIESSSMEHEAQLQTLQNEVQDLRLKLAEAREALSQAESAQKQEMDLEAVQERIRSLEEENRSLREQMEERMTPAAAEEALPGKNEPIRLDAPILPVGEVLSVDAAPSKDFSELELAAYRRAEIAERLARERTQDVYRKLQSVFQSTGMRLDQNRADLEALTRALQSDVTQMMSLLSSIQGAYRDAELSFGEVRDQNQILVENVPSEEVK